MRTILIITITVCFLAWATTACRTESDGELLLAAASAGDIETIEFLLEEGGKKHSIDYGCLQWILRDS